MADSDVVWEDKDVGPIEGIQDTTEIQEEEDFGFHVVDEEILIQEHEEEQERKHAFLLENLPQEVREKLCQSWPSLENKTILTYPMDKAKEEMEKFSHFKQICFELGLIRPFLYLVSMHPLTRYSIAQTMGITIEKYPEFGDSHFESYFMIAGHKKKSLQARIGKLGSKSGNWFSLLSLVMKTTMKSSSRISKPTKSIIKQSKYLKKDAMKLTYNINDSSVKALEEAFLIGLYEIMESLRNEHHRSVEIPEEWAYTLNLADSEIVDPLVNQLIKFGDFHHKKLMRMLCATALRSRSFHMTQNLNNWTEVCIFLIFGACSNYKKLEEQNLKRMERFTILS